MLWLGSGCLNPTCGYRTCSQDIPEPRQGNPSRNVCSLSLHASPVLLSYRTQEARTTAVAQNPEMRVDGYDTTERKGLNYPKCIPCFLLQPHAEPFFRKGHKIKQEGENILVYWPLQGCNPKARQLKVSLQMNLIAGRAV